MALVSTMPASDCLSDPSKRSSRHSKYYIQDSLTTFVVEDQLFRVHRYFFEWESEFFKALFSLPACGEGTSDDAPIPLPGVSIEEFESLLDYFYFRQSIGHSPLSRDHWMNLLSITSRYDFDDIRERAIKEISAFRPPLEPMQLIELANRHDVPQWLEPAYCALCQRPQPMNEAEVNKVGLQLAVKISQARDALRRTKASRLPQQKQWKNPWEGNTFLEADVRRIVKETFWPFGPKS